ncbi:Lysosomal thioesterase PPT2-A [Geodia barretti]|jgi:hypothetical protein|nr:Lysosomal thioesterase PPT2-A [Geodia barretti]
MKIEECVDQEFYTKNSFGLRTLDDSGRLHIHTVEGVHHFGFHKDQTVFDCCIKQWLD